MSSLGDAITRALEKRKQTDQQQPQDNSGQDQADPNIFVKAKQLLGYGDKPKPS